MDYNYNGPEWQQDNHENPERSPYPPQYQQTGSQVVLREVTQQNENRFAVTTLVLGIVALLFFWFPIVSFILGAIGMIMAITSLIKEEHRVMAIVGLILSMVGLALSSLMFLGYIVEYLTYYG